MASLQENDECYMQLVHVLQADMWEVLGLKKQKVLGHGSFGKVILAKRDGPQRTLVAVKKIKLVQTGDSQSDSIVYKKRESMFLNEVKIMSQLDFDFVMQFIIAVKCPKYFAIVMPFCRGGDLFGRLSSLTVDESKKFSKQIAQAVDHLHCKKIYHSDIKPENVLLFHDRAVLGDLGLAGIMTEGCDKIIHNCGTETYRAPETYTVMPVCPFKADLYSLGITIWSTVTGRESIPFQDFTALIQSIKKNGNLPPGYWHIIKKLTNLDPHLRPSLAEIIPNL